MKPHVFSMPLSLNARILTSIIIMFLLSFAIFAIYMMDTSKQLRRAMAHVEAKALTQHFSVTDNMQQLPQTYDDQNIAYALYNTEGELLQRSGAMDRKLRLNRDVINQDQWTPEIRSVGYVINVPVYIDDKHILMVARNDISGREMIDQILKVSLRSSLSFMVPILLLFATIIWLLLRWTLKPVIQAANKADAITPNTLEPIPTAPLPAEIKPLVQAANHAMQRMAQAYQAEQRFVADAAHELRTPLTLLSLRLHRLSSGEKVHLDELKQELKHIQKLVEQLLALARLEGLVSEDTKHHEEFDVVRLAREVIVEKLPLFEQQQRTIELDTRNEPLLLTGNPYLLGLAFGNLLENALFHGEGKVIMRFMLNGKQLCIQCDDEGESPPLRLRQQLFERFKKARENSSGSGLGLSIVRQTILNMQGSVHFRDTSYTSIEICLPFNASKSIGIT